MIKNDMCNDDHLIQRCLFQSMRKAFYVCNIILWAHWIYLIPDIGYGFVLFVFLYCAVRSNYKLL